MTIEAGTVLSERYRLDELIAIGGMGQVWRARDETLGRDVAVKLLKREYADDAGFVERFRNEARHTAGLAHPGIASVHDYGESGDATYLVMELVPGEPLSATLAREGRLDATSTLTVVGQVAHALQAAHANDVVHRDVKPGNILVTPEDLRARVTDFGIARASAGSSLTQTGTMLGTAHYVSPEQAMGHGVSPASDVYSLGVVTYECLAGYRPFDEDSPVALAMAHAQSEPAPMPEDVPEPVRRLVMQAMAKRPEERFASAGAFAAAIATVQEEISGGVSAPLREAASAPVTRRTALLVEPGLRELVRRKTAKSGLFIALGVALVLLLLAAAVSALRAPAAAQVPVTAGKSLEAAEAVLAEAGLDVDRIEKRVHSNVRSGLVIGTTPPAGRELHRGDDVVLVVSAGPPGVRLPIGLVGQPYDTAARALAAVGLRPVREETVTTAARAGTVVDVRAAPTLRRGDAVTLVVAKAPARAPARDGGKGEGKGDKGEDKGDD